MLHDDENWRKVSNPEAQAPPSQGAFLGCTSRVRYEEEGVGGHGRRCENQRGAEDAVACVDAHC